MGTFDVSQTFSEADGFKFEQKYRPTNLKKNISIAYMAGTQTAHTTHAVLFFIRSSLLPWVLALITNCSKQVIKCS